MEEVVIITRDINGSRIDHYLHWDKVCDYIQQNLTDEDEILLVIVEDTCIYSSLFNDRINCSDLLGFFA